MLFSSMIFLWVFLPFVITGNALLTWLPFFSEKRRIRYKNLFLLSSDVKLPSKSLLKLNSGNSFNSRRSTSENDGRGKNMKMMARPRNRPPIKVRNI